MAMVERARAYWFVFGLMALLLLGCAPSGEDDSGESGGGDTAASVVGAWGQWDNNSRHVLIFYSNGYYFQWCDGTNDPNCGTIGDGTVEIGTYSYDASTGTLSNFQHVSEQDGGGFDNSDDTGPYAGSIDVSFSADGNTATLTFRVEGGSFSFNRVTSSADPLIGAWGQWDESARHVLIFYDNGYYFQWCDGTNDPNCGTIGDGTVEIGTYTRSSDLSGISNIAHVVNGGGGFDNATNDGPYTGTIGTSFSADEKTLTLTFDAGSASFAAVR